ncbi:MAG: helix-turn-helix transcriptional regulator [Streptosporangiaceae bacterium]
MTSDIAAVPGNLPAEPNSFIGRERDLTDLVAILGRVRALTLCGPGGIGKTRLALRLGAMLGPEFADGVWIADLAEAELAGAGGPRAAAGGAEPGDRLVPVVCAALGVRAEPDRPLADTLVDALRPQAALVILDTCEHLVQGCAELVHRLLAACPRLRVIATSREPLGVAGEIIWRVPPLGLPPADLGLRPSSGADLPQAGTGQAVFGQAVFGQAGSGQPGSGQPGSGQAGSGVAAQSEAVRLFVERAGAARPGFALTEANQAAVADICRTLDGVPLAIELAAARVRTLSPEQIAGRLADRFELLAMGDRTAPPRQQTLRAAVQWSVELLAPAERLLLSRLSVFHGWDLEMAEHVCADERLPADEVLGLLRALIDKSLVSADTDVAGEARYRLLDTVRELAAEQAGAIGERPVLRFAHRDYLLGRAERIAAVAFVRGEPAWSERVAMYHQVRADRANFNAALACCVERGDAERGLRLCDALSGSWLASGDVADGADWIDRLLALPGPVPPGIQARALVVRAEMAFERENYGQAESFARASLELSDRCADGNPAGGYRLIALTELMSARLDQALTSADAAVAAARAMGDDWEQGVALGVRAAVIAARGDLAGAEEMLGQALEVLADNNGWGVANVLYGLGRVARAGREPEAAARHFQAALGLYRQIDARPEMARCLAGIGWLALSAGDLPAAAASLTQSMRLCLAAGHRLPIARGLQALAALAQASGDLEQAIRLTGAARAVFSQVSTPRAAAAVRRLDRLLDAARDQAGAAEIAAWLAQGQAMSPYQAAELAVVPKAAGPRRDEPSPAGPLTEREIEIAVLVAAGLSNRAIGEKLFIATATVARHVANIFAKLGLNSRAELAAWVTTQDPPLASRDT